MEPPYDECADKTQLNQNILDEYTHRTAAEVAYIYDPSIQNCKILKNAQESYLNAMEQLANCTVKSGQDSDLINQIEDAREELKQLNCQ